MALSDKQISQMWSEAHDDTSDRMAHQVLARAIEAEVRKQDTELIRKLTDLVQAQYEAGFTNGWQRASHGQAQGGATEEVKNLRKALVYAAFALHDTPQYMLAQGITLIDGDTVRVSRDGWTVEASVNPHRQPAPATQQTGERVYAFRRKGLADFCTCDEARYEELSNKPHLFETRIFYTAPPPVEREPQCWCLTCRPMRFEDPYSIRMALCPTCGNKRCPKANDHRNTCTGSNEPGQPGSAYFGGIKGGQHDI
jgi:hypothetical protein